MMELHAAAKQFYNLTLADPEVIIRPPSAEKRDAITQAGERLRAALVAASPCAAQPPEPLNGIPATDFHGEGAIARCSYCGRYSLDRKTLGEDRYQPVCECGEKHGWSGSFKRPGPDAKWSGEAPAAAQGGQQPDDEFSALYQRAMREPGIAELASVIAPPVPAAPLTAERIAELWHGGRAPGHDIAPGYAVNFARAIEAAHGITLAGTAQKESADGR